MTALPHEGERVCAVPACGAVLARDNGGEICTPCRRARKDKNANRERVLAALQSHARELVTVGQLAEELYFGESTVDRYVGELKETHRIEIRRGKGIRYLGERRDRGKTGGDDPPPPGLPEDALADEAKGRAPAGPPNGPPPFAGVEPDVDFADSELAAMEGCVAALLGLDVQARNDVLDYLIARFRTRIDREV